MDMDIKDDRVRSTNAFLVVGVGASAGGLEAFKQFIQAIPVDSGIAYILVQHLDPNHESILVEILQKSTSIPISSISDNIHVEPDHIYVIPSNKLLTANDGVLNLTPRSPKAQKSMSIDLFFTSLAEVHHSQAIGVVMSGTGDDGTLGLKAIKQLGGITFAQLPESAGYDEMPRNAIKSGVVDFVLSPQDIVIKLKELKEAFRFNGLEDKTPTVQPQDVVYRQILSMIDLQKGVDFMYYKQTTIRRRINRRMVLNNLRNLEDYCLSLKDNPTEIDTLYNDILIPVTDFFRDPQTFKALSETAFTALAQNRLINEVLRIWVVGCSTGQEAYSLGMSLHEFSEQHHERVKVQIFATDISDIAIAKARSGMYTENEVSNVPVETLHKYFDKSDKGYQINKPIRDMCVFATHNVLVDPPFASIDLISCRNMLIYMDTFLQRKAMTTFHYSLKPKGMLLLGKSESLGKSSDLFAVFNDPEKIYQRKIGPGKFVHIAAKRREEIRAKENLKLIKEQRATDDYQKNADDIILSKCPAGVIVNDQLEIVQFRGNTGEWLEAPSGKPNLNVIKMAKEGLSLDLRSILQKAKSTQKSVTKEGILLPGQLSNKAVTLEAIPLLHTINPYYLVLFKNVETKSLSKGKQVSDNTNGKKAAYEIRSLELEKELIQTREDMKNITEDQDAGNEELLNANEELLSSGEELRSLNEELEISKEELQSTVEELLVANQEMTFRNEQLNYSRNYAEAILTTIRQPLIVLDKDFRIKSANRSFYKKFQVREQETDGQEFFSLENNQWDVPGLRDLLEKTLNHKIFYESFEIRKRFPAIGERVMLLNARKILSEGNNETLILLVIEDITDRKELEETQKEQEKYTRKILDSSPTITSTASADGKITYSNKVFLEYAGLTLEEAVTLGWDPVLHPDQKEDVVKDWMESVATGKDFHKEILLKRHDGVFRWHVAHALPLTNDEGSISSWVCSVADIHDQKIFAEELERKVNERTQELKTSNIHLEHSNKNLEQFAFIASHDLQEPLRKIITFSNMLSDSFGETTKPEHKTIVNKIKASSLRMSTLIRDVLNLSRIQETENDFVKTDLNHIIQEVLIDFSLLIEEKQATITKEKLPTIFVIPLQMSQLFNNLMSNALKFTDDGVKPVISITSRRMAKVELANYPYLNPEVLHYEILFEDNGIGFENKYHEKIFEIFQRLHTRDKFPGTGIGLALCRKIIFNHHGVIFAESKVDTGTLFHIILPIGEQLTKAELLPG